MKKSIIILVFLVVTNYSLLSQESTFSLSLSGGYGWQLAEKEEYKMVNSYDQQRMADFDVNLSYYLTDQFSLGLGVGIAGYNNTNLVTFPAFIDLRYSFEKCPNLFTYVDIGMPLSAEAGTTNWLSDYNQDYNSGFFTNVGLGWKRAVSRTTAIRFSLGYQCFPFSTTIYKDEETMRDERIKHELLLQVGFEFYLTPVYGEKARAEQKKKRREFWLKELILLIFY